MSLKVSSVVKIASKEVGKERIIKQMVLRQRAKYFGNIMSHQINVEYGIIKLLQNMNHGVSLVAHRLRIHLPMQGTRVRALVREDPTCCAEQLKPMCHKSVV